MKFKLPPIFWIILGIVLLFNIPQAISLVMIKYQLFSDGNKLLIAEKATTEKIEGIEAYKNTDYKTAIKLLTRSLKLNPNDPEAMIYLNNAKAQEHNPLKLALVVPISSNLNISLEMMRGVAQAQNEINQKGGINGRFILVRIVDDGNDPNKAKNVAHSLVNDQEILAVIGHNASNASLAAAPIYQKGGLVMVNPTSFANGISEMGDYIFRTVTNLNLMVKPLVEYAITNHKLMAICSDSQAADGVSFKDEFINAWKAKGGQIATTACDLNNPNFDPSSEITTAINNGSDSLLIIPHIDRLDNAYKLAVANQGKLKLFSSSTLYNIKTLQVGQAMQGMTLVVNWSPKNPANMGFASSARQMWGGDVTWRTASAYDATSAIITGLQTDKTRDTLQKALENPLFVAKTSNGDVKFLPNGDREGKPIIVQMQPSKLNPLGFDFIPIPSQ